MEKYLEQIHEYLDYLQEVTLSLEVDKEFEDVRHQTTHFERFILARNITAEMYPRDNDHDWHHVDFTDRVHEQIRVYFEENPFKPSYQITK